MTKRTYVRITSFLAFGLAILIASVLINTKHSNSYKNQLEISYQQSLVELDECLETVGTDLTKSLYSNSSGEIYDLSRSLYTQCGVAKNAVSRLPISQMELSNIYKFLSQTSDYAQYIAGKIERNEEISDEEHKNLLTLLKYCQKFSTATSEMVGIVEKGGKIVDGDIYSNNTIKMASLNNNFSQSAKTFESFPTLLYDGPFSDQVLNKKSQLVSNGDVKSKDDCKKIVAKCLGVNEMKINFEADEQSKMPCYTYTCGRYTVSVTKQGGYIKSILYSGAINDSNITTENAINIAKEFLNKIGYKNMAESYYNISENVCTINFAYADKNVYQYSDLIKCGVSMSDGKIISLDAQTYLTNHIERPAFSPSKTADECKAFLSKYLSVNSVKNCIIPKESGIEVACYEFSCTSKDTGEDTLVYINCNTGREEDIMLLLNTENGTLVK